MKGRKMKLNIPLRHLRTGPVIFSLGLVCLSSFGVYSLGLAAPPEAKLPFANSNEQRSEILLELREIKTLLTEQNALLKQNASKDAQKR